MLWHVMKIYSHYGYNDFVICLGYKATFIKEYLFKLISIENYEGLQILNNLNPLLYYSVIDDQDFSTKIEFFEEDCVEFYDIITNIIKKLLPIYINLLK